MTTLSDFARAETRLHETIRTLREAAGLDDLTRDTVPELAVDGDDAPRRVFNAAYAVEKGWM
jgi:hypothetical protein